MSTHTTRPLPVVVEEIAARTERYRSLEAEQRAAQSQLHELRQRNARALADGKPARDTAAIAELVAAAASLDAALAMLKDDLSALDAEKRAATKEQASSEKTEAEARAIAALNAVERCLLDFTKAVLEPAMDEWKTASRALTVSANRLDGARRESGEQSVISVDPVDKVLRGRSHFVEVARRLLDVGAPATKTTGREDAHHVGENVDKAQMAEQNAPTEPN